MGNFYTSAYKEAGNPVSWDAYSSSSSSSQDYNTANRNSYSFTAPIASSVTTIVPPGTTTNSATKMAASDTGFYTTQFSSSFNATSSGSSSASLTSGSAEAYGTVIGSGEEANPGITYSYPQAQSSRFDSTTSSDDTGSYYTVSSIQLPLTDSYTYVSGTSSLTSTITNSLYQTNETTSVDETTKWDTALTDLPSNFSTGAATETYEGSVSFCSTDTKSTNDSDTVSSKFTTSFQSLELTTYSDSSSTNETYSRRSASTITVAGACRTNCLLAGEFYLDTNEILTVSSDAIGNALASSQIYTTRGTGPISYAFSRTMGGSVMEVAKGYIDASIYTITDSTADSAKYITRTVGVASEIPYVAYTLDSNYSIVQTNLTRSHGATAEEVDSINAPVYTLTGLTAQPVITTCASVFPYYLTYTSNTTTINSLVGYVSLEQTTIVNGVAESTDFTYTSSFTGVSNSLTLNTSTTYGTGGTTLTSILTDVAVLTYATTDIASSLDSDSSVIGTYVDRSTTFSESFSRSSSGRTSIASSEGHTRYYRIDTIKDVSAYGSPFNGIQDFVPVMAPGTKAFGGFDESDSYTSNLAYHSLTLGTDGETFTNYDDSFITANLISRDVGYGVQVLPTGKCFNIPSATSATYQWMTSSDWAKSGTSSQLSARFASTSEYTTSGGVLGNTSVETRTTTDYKSLTMSLSLISAVEEASVTGNFVRYDEMYGVSLQKLDEFVDVGYGINHTDNMDRSRQLHFPAGHYSISAYGVNQGTSVISEYTTQSTAAWLQSVDDNIRLRIIAEPLYYIATRQAFAGGAGLGVGIASINEPYEDSNYYDTDL